MRVPITRDYLREAVADGMTLAEVGREVGLHYQTVGRTARRAGIHFPHGGQPDPCRRAAVMAAVRDGCRTTPEVARRIGVSRTLVWRWGKQLEAGGMLRLSGRGRNARLTALD